MNETTLTPTAISIRDLYALAPTALPGGHGGSAATVQRWIAAGLLRPDTANPGSGQRRRWTFGDARAVVLAERLAVAGRTGRRGNVAWYESWLPVFDWLHQQPPHLGSLPAWIVHDLHDNQIHVCDHHDRAGRVADTLVNACRRQTVVVRMHDIDPTITRRLCEPLCDAAAGDRSDTPSGPVGGATNASEAAQRRIEETAT